MNNMIRKVAVTISAWICLLLAAGGYAQVTADISPPPDKFLITPGGVDIRTGRFAFSQSDLSIGDKSGGLEFSRLLSTALLGHIDPLGNFSHNWDITLLEKKIDIRKGHYKHGQGSDFRLLVNFGGRTDTFDSRNKTDASIKRMTTGPLTTLQSIGDRNSDSVIYTYTDDGGVKITFRALGSRDCSTVARCAYPSKIINPDGTTFAFEYETTGVVNGTRLRSVTNNRGYALLLEYSGTGTYWNLVTKACVLNLAQIAKPANNVCPVTVVTASYAYTAYNGMPMLASITDAVGATSTISYAASTAGATDGVPNNPQLVQPTYSISYTKAGHTVPWQMAHIKLRPDAEGTADHIVGRQNFADGSRYDYSYDLALQVGTTPASIAGGAYRDALGNATSISYESIQLPYDAWVTMIEGQSDQLDPLTPYPQDESPFLQMTPGPTTVTDPLGRTTFFDYCERIWYTHSVGCLVGMLQSVTDPEDIVTEYWYSSGYIKKSQRIAKSGSGLPDIIRSTSRNCASVLLCGKLQSSTDPVGNVTEFTYDPVHGGVLTATAPPATSGGIRPQKRYTYQQFYAWYKNSAGTLVQATTPVWLLTTISECRTLAICTNTADERRTTITYGTPNAANNLLPTSVTISAGDGSVTATTIKTYDNQGNVLTVDGPLPSSSDTTRIRYDALRRVIGTISPDPDGIGPLANRATRNTYNPAGDLIKVEKGTVIGLTDSAWLLFTAYQAMNTGYDLMGRKTRESIVANGVTHSVIDYSYDLAQRLECTAVRMNPTQWVSQTSACTPQTNGPNGPDRVTRNVYNAAGERIKVQVAVGTVDQADEKTITYTANGQVKTITDGEGNITTYGHDGHDRLLKIRFPDKTDKGSSSETDYEEFAYDLNGNTIQRRLRDGQLINYGFDNLNRQVLKDLPVAEVDVTSSYDLQSNLLQAVQGSSSLTLTWDSLGRNLSEMTQFGTMTYRYDAANRRIRTTWPDDFFVSHDYLITGEISAIREYGVTSGVGVLATYSYDNLGQRRSIVRGNGTVTKITYDGASRLASLSQDLVGTSQDVASTFTFNPANQIITWARNNNAYAWTAHSNVNRSYGINGLNQITAVGSVNVSYDNRGNLINQGSGSYGYTVENRLVSGPNSASFTYDPIGRLSQSSGISGATRFQYDGADLVAEYNASNQLQRRYVHGPGIDEPLVWYEGAGTTDRRWLHQDERGSTGALSGSSGTTIAINSYDEFGVPAPANLGRFQYTGQTWMAELGMYYYKARIYDPKLGRFLQTDPIGYEDQLNFYAYVGNDPVNNNDPTGMVLDTIADVGFIAYDIYTIATEGATAVNLAALGADVAGTAIPFATGGGTAVRAAHAAEAAVSAKKADFIVDSNGTAVRNSADGARKDLEAGGYPGEATTQTAENGTLHEGVQGKDGPMDVRIMDGQANGNELKGERIRTTASGTNDGVRSDGSKFRNNEDKTERLQQSHIHLNK